MNAAVRLQVREREAKVSEDRNEYCAPQYGSIKLRKEERLLQVHALYILRMFISLASGVAIPRPRKGV